MTEQWLPVVGYEGLYEVSDLGNIRSLDRVTQTPSGGQRRYYGKLLKPAVLRKGHLMVFLYRSGQSKPTLVHRAVLTAFIGECPDGMECCHRNDDPQNNRLENLYWGTRSQNQLDRARNGIHYLANKTHCKWGHPFDEANTRLRPGRNFNRICRECHREQNRRHDRKRRAAS